MLEVLHINIAAELNFFQNQNINSLCLEAEREMKVLGFWSEEIIDNEPPLSGR